MRAFAKLISQIEQTNSTNEKVDLMAQFFKSRETTDPEAAAWALYFLSGQRPKKFIGSKTLRAWAEELAGIPAWLSEECYSAVGDTAEMIALVLAPCRKKNLEPLPELSLAAWMNDRLEPLKRADENVQKSTIQGWWTELSVRETYILNKLMTGALRIGVSETLVYRALSQAFEVPRTTIASRLLGKWFPSAELFRAVTRAPEQGENGQAVDEAAQEALPIPFCLAASLEGTVQDLGPPQDWQVEWKWDGIRAQVVKVGAQVEIWSRGEERITEAFPDLTGFFSTLSGNFTLDGEILAGKADLPTSFNDLQKRLNRKQPSASMLRENPVAFLAYDLLREGERNLTAEPLSERRSLLERWVEKRAGPMLGVSPVLPLAKWQDAAAAHAKAREHLAEGLMIKRKDAPYATGRKRGIWFKWKVQPLTLDAVLTAAQPGTGRRASLYTDYTFGIWKDEKLVPIAKAYSGLTDEEIRELDGWIRKHTVERHGPVRVLKPERVFEIGFEGIAESSRHKSGFAVRFPRILRERTDKPASEADRVESVQSLFSSLSKLSARNGEQSEPDLFGNTDHERE
jgi:DNA ligase-1